MADCHEVDSANDLVAAVAEETGRDPDDLRTEVRDLEFEETVPDERDVVEQP